MFAFLADVHISNKLKESDYMNSLNFFLKHIEECDEPCHAIFVLGDLFDHRLDVQESKTAIKFLLRLAMNGCGKEEKPNVPIYMIHGTYSHDLEQYDIFIPSLMKIPNVEIHYTNTMKATTIDDKFSVLLLPQEYNREYNLNMNNKYDIIIGHGVLTYDYFADNGYQHHSPCKAKHGDFQFSIEKLSKVSNVCVFGHFHEYTDFGGNVFYAGSMLRTKYNEDTPKQFIFCNDDWEVHTVLNPYAVEYKTIPINTPESLRAYISNGITTPHRFVLTYTPETVDEYIAIMNVNKNNKNISYVVNKTLCDEQHTDTGSSDLIISKKTSITNPIPELISYIKEKNQFDVSKEINDYVAKIENKEET